MRQSRLWIPIVAVFAILVVISFFRSAPDHRTAISYGDVLAAAHSGKLEGVTVRGDELDVRLRGMPRTTSRASVLRRMVARNLQEATLSTATAPSSPVNLVFRDNQASSWDNWGALVLQLALFGIVMYAVVYFAMVRALRHCEDR